MPLPKDPPAVERPQFAPHAATVAARVKKFRKSPAFDGKADGVAF